MYTGISVIKALLLISKLQTKMTNNIDLLSERRDESFIFMALTPEAIHFLGDTVH